MNIAELAAQADWTFLVVANDGRVGQFDIGPYLQHEAFEPVNDISELMKIKMAGISSNGNAERISQRI